MPIEAAKALVRALFLSRCDYHNGLLVGVSVKQLGGLQRILNAAARLIYRGSSREHVRPLLRDRLHWLRIKECLTYKLCQTLRVYKSLYLGSPAYIRNLVNSSACNSITSWLRSAAPQAGTRIVCPRIHHRYGERGFSYAGSMAWNGLPSTTRLAPSLETFKTELKTTLYSDSLLDNLLFMLQRICPFSSYVKPPKGDLCFEVAL